LSAEVTVFIKAPCWPHQRCWRPRGNAGDWQVGQDSYAPGIASQPTWQAVAHKRTPA
jgi:hypothetical protein